MGHSGHDLPSWPSELQASPQPRVEDLHGWGLVMTRDTKFHEQLSAYPLSGRPRPKTAVTTATFGTVLLGAAAGRCNSTCTQLAASSCVTQHPMLGGFR
jgi:hypothetical protein